MNKEARIVHEAASQRQHIRLKAPILADIDGQIYEIEDWSVGGVRIKGFDRETSEGATFPVTLHFPFNGFEMSIDATVSVRHHDASRQIVGASFVEMTPQRLSLLRYVIDAYLSGELVNAGDILQVVERDNSARARASVMPEVQRSRGSAILFAMRRNFGLALALVAALILALYIAFNLYTRTFTVSGDGAITSPQGTVLRATGAGSVIGFAARPGQRVQPGTLLATLQKPTGGVINITSKCDCIVGEHLADLGEPLAKSAPILSMAPTNGTTRATLVVRLKEIRKVSVGDRVAVTFFNDNKVAKGVVDRINLPGLTDPTTLQQNGLKVPELAGSVSVRFDDEIGVKRIGQPVSGRVRLYRIIPFID